MTHVDEPVRSFDAAMLPEGMRTRMIDNGAGLCMHVLEAGYQRPGRPCILLLHGFPELAYSWRKVMPALAQAGYYVVAPDQRGYGRTTGWDPSYDGDVGLFAVSSLVRDVLGLVLALGLRSVAAVVGHDLGSRVAAWCALIRPDVFQAVALMSAPFAGPPRLSFDTAQPSGRDGATAPAGAAFNIEEALAQLQPPRKHYQWYFSSRQADQDMRHGQQGIHAFLRAYFHVKSADWKGNVPFRLASWSAAELARLPRYYVMDLDADMAQTVAQTAPSDEESRACAWLTDDELRIYSAEYERTGFQGGLQWYRAGIEPRWRGELQVYSGRTIDVPCCYIAGQSDWGIYQAPGVLEAMSTQACTRFLGRHLVEGAGHWIQQERPQSVVTLLLEFMRDNGAVNLASKLS